MKIILFDNFFERNEKKSFWLAIPGQNVGQMEKIWLG